MGKVLAVLEQRDGRVRPVSLEVLAAARALAGADGEVQALVAGPEGTDVTMAARHGADAIRLVTHEAFGLYQPDALTGVVARRMEETGCDTVALAASATGKDLAPRIAARLGAPLAADVTEIGNDGHGLRLARPVYAGRARQTVRIRRKPFVVSLRPRQFEPVEADEATVETVAWTEPVAFRSKTLALRAGQTAALDVSEAPIVVSGGRGLREPGNFGLIENLAAALGGAVGASRAVVDAGWREHAEQVGQTGKVVAPDLYVAVGISGAIQHLAGMRDARVIVAINNDPDAPIFNVADYGIVGDLFEVVPALTAAVRKLKDS